MDKFTIEPQDIMPGISLDPVSGKLKFYGRSCPINAHEFYEPVIKWVEEYLKQPAINTVAEFYLSYFNTVSAKNILKIMNKLEGAKKTGNNAMIRWIYNDNDEILKDAGKDFEMIVDLKFEFIALKKDDDSDEEESFLFLTS
jgi:hypothetical protein